MTWIEWVSLLAGVTFGSVVGQLIVMFTIKRWYWD